MLKQTESGHGHRQAVHPLVVPVGLVTPKVLPYQLKKRFSVNLMDPVRVPPKKSVEANGSKTSLVGVQKI